MKKFTVTTFTVNEVYEAWKKASPENEQLGRPEGFELRWCGGDGSIELTWDTFDQRGDECSVNLYADDVAALLGVKPGDSCNAGWSGTEIKTAVFQVWQPVC